MREYGAGMGAPCGDQPLDGSPDAVFRQTAHFQQPSLQLFEFLLKMRNHTLWHQPNLPVT